MNAMPQRSATLATAVLLGCLPTGTHATGDVDACPVLANVPVSPQPYRRTTAPLFPSLSLRDFPATPDTVRVRARAQSTGYLEAETFHRRHTDVGFDGVITARVAADERTAQRTLTLTRLDDHCVEAAARHAVEPGRLCARLVATELARDVVVLRYEYPYVGHALTFTMARDRDDKASWSLVHSGRFGEPRELRWRLEASGDNVESHWFVADETERASYEQRLGATLAAREFAGAELNDIELGLLNALAFFDDLGDEHLPWVPYGYGTEIVDSGDSPGDEDFGECTISTTCDVVYQSCTPVEGGWLGCSGGIDVGWGHTGDDGGKGGGGHGTPQPDPLPPTPPKPDWQIGFVPPLFLGVETGDLWPWNEMRLKYVLSSVLRSADTYVQPFAYFDANGYYTISDFQAAHLVHVYLMEIGDVEHVCDGGTRYARRENGAIVPVGDFAVYGPPRAQCADVVGNDACEYPPRPGGIYELWYALDPDDQWDENVAGEENNVGPFRGRYLLD